ncbi:ribonuclease H-like domain-containing protein [Tanacetum coccineum]
MARSEDDIPPPPPPPSQRPTQQTPYTVSTIKLPILKKGEYDIWAMKMEHYLDHTGGEGLHKGYDRFQSLLSQLEIHGAGISTEDENQKFFRSLPSSWSQVSLIMRTKPRVDSLKNTSSTNDVSTAYGVSNSSGHNSQYEHTSSYSLLANQSSCPQLDHEDLEQLDEFDLEEIDLKWQVAMISMRMKKSKGNQYSRRRDAWNTRNKDKENGRRSGKQEDSKALVTLDGAGIDWTTHSEDEQENYALMACSSSGSDTKVTYCSKECKESYATLKKLYDEQREQLGDVDIEIQAYTQALKKVEAQLVTHQQIQLWYEEKIRFMKIDLDDKTNVLTYHKKLLAEAEKEKEDLKAKVEKWHNSSKNLNILLNSQMSARDKAGLRYSDQMNKGVLSYENKVIQSVFVSRTSDIEDSPMNDRYAEGMHAVPPLMTRIYIPFGPDKEIDDSQFTYGPKQSKPSESDARNSDFNSCESNYSDETHEFTPELIMYDQKNKVLFTDTECLVLSPEFKLPDENQVLLRIPRQNNMYSLNLENIIPSGGLACLIAKAIIDESNKWHRRLGHVNFKNLNKLVKGNLVRGLPSKIFQNDHTCVACQKGKQHKASCKAKLVSSISQPLQLLHMDLFGPTSNLRTGILLNSVGQKGSRGNTIMLELHNKKKIMESSQEENNQSDFWDDQQDWEIVTWRLYEACGVYILELKDGTVIHMLVERRYPLSKDLLQRMLNLGLEVERESIVVLDHLGKFDGKSDEGFLVGYSLQSKAFRVYNLETKRVEENLHITFLENKPNVVGEGPTWLFDLDYLTDSMNYKPVRSENQANKHAGPKEANHSVGIEDNIDAGNSEIEAESTQDYFVLSIWSSYTSTVKSS